MILRACLLVLLFAGSKTWADEIQVVAGEHADFSRIVIQLPKADNWMFGRTKGGYELRLDTTDAQFDFTQVFQKIPKSRIRSVGESAAGRLFLEVSCNCHADAFEIRNGRIVLDVKDGAPTSGSEFEVELPEAKADALLSARIPAADQANNENGGLFNTADADVEAKPGLQPIVIELPNFGDVKSPAEDLSEELTDRPINDERVDPPRSVSLDSQLLPLFGFQSEMQEVSGLSVTSVTRLDRMEEALLKQLSRASSQGLIVVEPTAITGPTPKPMAKDLPSEQQSPDTMPAAADRGQSHHIRVETAIDRAAPESADRRSMTFEGDDCLPDEYFDVASWGEKDTGSGLSIAPEHSVLGEFDVPLAEEIEMAARHYVFLGFGAEAKALLAAFPADIDRADVLWQLAEIVDNPDTDRAAALQNQISCKTSAAMWSVLGSPDLRPGEPVEAAAVLQNFSGLPIHLRRYLGPVLAARLLNAGDPATATTIRNMLARNPNVSETGVGLLQARIDAELGKTDASLEQLHRIVAEGGSDSAVALVELIDAQFAAGQPVDPMTSELAEAFAYENKGTELGRKLSVTAIRGMIASHRIGAAFAAIVAAENDHSLSAVDAASLLADTHLKNAETSTNVEFLRLLQSFGNPSDSPEARTARHAVSARLLKLGFTDQARTILLAKGRPPDHDDRIYLAKAALSDRKPELALSYLAGLAEGEAPALRANALELAGESQEAARLYHAEDMAGDAGRAAWVAADWETVAIAGTDPQKAVAELLAPVAEPEPVAEGLAESGVEAMPDLAAAAPEPEAILRSGRTLVEHSAQTRQALATLLVPQ